MDSRDFRNADAAEDWLDSWVARANAQAETSVQLARQVAALTATAHNTERTITVRVGANGQVEQLDLDDRALYAGSGRELSREILAVMRQAQRKLTAEVTAEVETTVGADSETGRAVIGAFDRRFATREDDRDR